jgi:ribonuclease G
MYREILVNVTNGVTKVAVLEEGQVAEIYVEQGGDERIIGNIYKGIVNNVLPGMQAAFVDIGLEKNAFLYVQDLSNCPANGSVNICDLVKEGQEIVVQVKKEPVGGKGARVTTKLTLPGRYLVLMPHVAHIGVSLRIEEQVERERLTQIASELKPEKAGLIVRTIAAGASPEVFKQDLKSLLKLWQKIKQRMANSSAPTLLHQDLRLIPRVLRDLFSEDVQKLRINSAGVSERILTYLDVFAPDLKQRVDRCDTQQLFDKYHVEKEIKRSLNRKVWLKNGAYLVFDQTEALTVIDVNTGKFIGASNLADTVFKTNCVAAREIVRQLRLRNIGGIIIIDFIDMDTEEHRQKVLDILENELKKDRVKTSILGLTALGFVEMTRKKIRPPLTNVLEKKCPFCDGKGRVAATFEN